MPLRAPGPDRLDGPMTALPGAGPAPTAAERVSRILLARSSLGALVRWVARPPVSVHAKLLTAFLLVVALFFAMGAASVRIATGIARRRCRSTRPTGASTRRAVSSTPWPCR